MFAALFLTATLQNSLSAPDFFPLKAGTVITYEDKSRGGQLQRVVSNPMDMGGVPVVPVLDKQGGRQVATTYYRVDSDLVTVIAYDIKHPLSPAMTLFRISGNGATWEYSGKTKVGPDGERLLAKGESKSVGLREVLGKKVESIEVKTITLMGVGMSSLKFESKAIYARGFGLVEWTEKRTLGNSKKSASATYKIVSYDETPKG